jgi:hypothetical protein
MVFIGWPSQMPDASARSTGADGNVGVGVGLGLGVGVGWGFRSASVSGTVQARFYKRPHKHPGVSQSDSRSFERELLLEPQLRLIVGSVRLRGEPFGQGCEQMPAMFVVPSPFDWRGSGRDWRGTQPRLRPSQLLRRGTEFVTLWPMLWTGFGGCRSESW